MAEKHQTLKWTPFLAAEFRRACRTLDIGIISERFGGPAIEKDEKISGEFNTWFQAITREALECEIEHATDIKIVLDEDDIFVASADGREIPAFKDNARWLKECVTQKLNR
jgi:hypothetical protein